MTTYRIVRFYKDKQPPNHRWIQLRGLSLETAQAHCADPETSSDTATDPMQVEHTKKHGAWFDGYEKEE